MGKWEVGVNFSVWHSVEYWLHVGMEEDGLETW